MNSTLQQIYMIPTLRKYMLKIEDMKFTEESEEDNMLLQLKVIIIGLLMFRDYFLD